jgi:hypothetical protein
LHVSIALSDKVTMTTTQQDIAPLNQALRLYQDLKDVSVVSNQI